MPWGYYHKQAVKEENREKLAEYITSTRQQCSRINGDITYYRTSQRLENDKSHLPRTLAKATDVPRDLRPDLSVGEIREMGRQLSHFEKLKILLQTIIKWIRLFYALLYHLVYPIL